MTVEELISLLETVPNKTADIFLGIDTEIYPIKDIYTDVIPGGQNRQVILGYADGVYTVVDEGGRLYTVELFHSEKTKNISFI